MIQAVPLPLTRGVNLKDDPTELKEGQWQALTNVVPKPSGKYGRRPALLAVEDLAPSWWHWDARTLTGSLGTASAVAGYWKWAQYLRPVKFIFDPHYGYISMVAITTASIAVMDQTDNITWVQRTVPAGTFLLITLPGIMADDGSGNPMLWCAVLGTGSRAPSLFSLNDRTYAFGGSNAGRYVSFPGSGTTPVDFSYWAPDFGATNSGFMPEGACVVRDRVVYFIGSNVYWSDKNAPLTVGADALATRGINLGGEVQEPITAIAEISLSETGSPVQSACAVWTKNNMYLLLGEPGESDAGTAEEILGSLQINKLNVRAGCISQSSITRTAHGVYWVGADDVWFMPTGSTPVRIGTNLRPLLLAQPPGVQWKIYTAYANGSLRLGLFSEGTGPNIFSPCDTQYWLDLRSDPPSSPEQAAWFGPQRFANVDCPDSGYAGVYCVAANDVANGDNQLYALQSYLLSANGLGSDVYGMTICGLDSYADQDVTAPYYSYAPWDDAYAYNVGDIVVPQPQTGASFKAPIWICSVAGTSGGSEPNWATNAASLTDNTVTWVPRYWDGTNVLAARATNQALSAQGNPAIAMALTSREVTGDTAVEKLLDGAEFVFWSPQALQVTYNSNPDQDERSRQLYPTFIGTANTTGSWGGMRNWQRKLLTPSPTRRFAALSATWNMAQDAGYVITVDVNDTLVFDYGGLQYTATITAGYYETIIDLVSAVIEAMGTAASTTNLRSSYEADGGYGRQLLGIQTKNGASLTIYTTSRLAQLLGYNPSQNAGAGYVTSTGFVYSLTSPFKQLAPPVEIGSITLRLTQFGRRPV